MAETVKKSRIVSDDNEDDNLEEALMEEFNMRLKNCMSQDDLLQQTDEKESIEEEEEEKEEKKPEEIEYANIEMLKNKASTTLISRDFIIAEKENFYEEPIFIEKEEHQNNDLKSYNNGHCIDNGTIDNIYEPVIHQTDKTDDDESNGKATTDQYIEMSLNSDQVEATTPQIVTKVEEEEIYENVSRRPDLTLTDLSEPSEQEMSTAIGSKSSVKDRMFLSTDAAPCLLFTQTVTSPMLTPSEENVDFLKDFTDSPKNDENIYENSEFLLKNKENLEEIDNGAIYENLKGEIVENIYENVSREVEELKKNEETVDEVFEENDGEIVCEISQISDEKEEELKSIDIIKQINKFESDDSTQVTETYVETTVESNSISDNNKSLKKKKSKKSRKEEKENISVNETNTNNNCLFNDNNYNSNNSEDSFFYNVNVKTLCRSFGDLTKIDADSKLKINNNNNNFKRQIKNKQQTDSINNNRTRTKSMSDVVLFIDNSVFSGVSVRALREKFHCQDNNGSLNSETNNCSRKGKVVGDGMKSSFSKFDALQKKNVLHVRSTDSSKAQEKFNGGQLADSSNCRACDKAVFQMEQIKAEKAIWHKNCFRCNECNKQLNVDTYQSHEGTLYCKPHFKALFAPKAVEEDTPSKPRKPELIIRESQPVELPPDVVRASDKPDLGLEELQTLNVKERFQVFENHQSSTFTETSSSISGELDRSASGINVKRSPSILSKLARFQAKGMDIGVADDSLNGIPIEESSSEDEEDYNEDEDLNGEDADLIRAKRVQKEKPFHFTGMNDVKTRWEQGEQATSRDERREERKQEIQSIRNRLFMGKQGKMKEAYQQAVMESESCTNLLLRKEPIEVCDTKSLKEQFEKGKFVNSELKEKDGEDIEVFESEISKNSRSLFLELDANASKPPQIAPVTSSVNTKLDVKKAREAYISKTSSEDVVKSSMEQVENVEIRTADIQQRFKFFETYKEPEQRKKTFRITPPREGQVKAPTPDREVYRDPEVVRSEETIEDSVVAKESHTATKMLNKFRQMEVNLSKEQEQPVGPKPLKCFTPPPEPARADQSSSQSESESEYEDEENENGGGGDEVDRTNGKHQHLDEDLIEAQKAARAKQLRAKFERWEANEIKREQNNSSVNIVEEFSSEEQSQIESTKALRARFESMRETNTDTNKTPRVKVNRFVEIPSVTETCESCNLRVYPLEKISVHNHIYHKNCFKCMECSCVLRMDSYSYNQGLLYCLPHFKRLFISKGNYETGFGLGQHKEKWNTTTAA